MERERKKKDGKEGQWTLRGNMTGLMNVDLFSSKQHPSNASHSRPCVDDSDGLLCVGSVVWVPIVVYGLWYMVYGIW